MVRHPVHRAQFRKTETYKGTCGSCPGSPAHEGAGKVSHPKFVDSARESTGLWTVISHQSPCMTGRSSSRKLRLLVVLEKVIQLSTNRPPRAVASWTACLSLESPAYVAQYAARVSEAEEFSTLGACAQCELLRIASHCIETFRSVLIRIARLVV